MEHPATPHDHQRDDARQAFLETWRTAEARGRRIGGLLLTFAGMLALAIEARGDELTALIATGLIAGGLWLIVRSGRARIDRIHLMYLQHNAQIQRSLLAGLAAVYTFYQGSVQNRPLFLLGGAVLLMVAAWYQWRAYQVRQYRTHFSNETSPDTTQETDTHEV